MTLRRRGFTGWIVREETRILQVEMKASVRVNHWHRSICLYLYALVPPSRFANIDSLSIRVVLIDKTSYNVAIPASLPNRNVVLVTRNLGSAYSVPCNERGSRSPGMK